MSIWNAALYPHSVCLTHTHKERQRQKDLPSGDLVPKDPQEVVLFQAQTKNSELSLTVCVDGSNQVLDAAPATTQDSHTQESGRASGIRSWTQVL